MHSFGMIDITCILIGFLTFTKHTRVQNFVTIGSYSPLQSYIQRAGHTDMMIYLGLQTNDSVASLCILKVKIEPIIHVVLRCKLIYSLRYTTLNDY